MSQLFVLCFSQLVIAFAIVYFILQVVKGNLLIGTLTFILASVGDLRQSLSGLFSNLGRQYQDSLFVTDIFKMLDLKPAVEKPKKELFLTLRKRQKLYLKMLLFLIREQKPRSLKISP